MMLRCLAGLVAGAGARPLSAAPNPSDVIQPARPDPTGFMERAVEMRRLAVERGDQPFGAVVVKDARIVGEGISAVVTGNDPTAWRPCSGRQERDDATAHGPPPPGAPMIGRPGGNVAVPPPAAL
jgi:hypothetical protein